LSDGFHLCEELMPSEVLKARNSCQNLSLCKPLEQWFLRWMPLACHTLGVVKAGLRTESFSLPSIMTIP
jgi:hypothetical protein